MTYVVFFLQRHFFSIILRKWDPRKSILINSAYFVQKFTHLARQLKNFTKKFCHTSLNKVY